MHKFIFFFLNKTICACAYLMKPELSLGNRNYNYAIFASIMLKMQHK